MHVVLVFVLVWGLGFPVLWPNSKSKISGPAWSLLVSLVVTIAAYQYLEDSGVAGILPSILGI